MDELGDKMEGTRDLNWEQSRPREIRSGESSIMNVELQPSGAPGISKGASNTVCDQAEEEKLLILSSADCVGNNRGSCGNRDNEIEADAFHSLSPLVHAMDDVEEEDVSLREWLNTPNRNVDRLECLHIFKQILEIVDLAHSQGVVLQNIRPSCFILSSFNRVSFIESASFTSSGSDSSEDSTGRLARPFPDQTQRANMWHGDDVGQLSSVRDQVEESSSEYIVGDEHQGRRVLTRTGSSQGTTSRDAAGIQSEASGRITYAGNCSLSLEADGRRHVTSADQMRSDTGEEIEKMKMEDRKEEENIQERNNCSPLKQILLIELNWYTSPEELAGASSSFSSDIYCLGVLFFELFCTFSSEMEQQTIMSNLRHRVLPPQLLLKWPKEASFCLWLLHPAPTCRPKLSEVLQSEIISEAREALEERQAAVKLKEKIADIELLLDFLLQVQQQKQERADKLYEATTYLSSDIEEVLKWQSVLQQKGKISLEFCRDKHSVSDKGKKSIGSLSELDQSEPSLNNSTGLPTGKTTILGKHLRQESKNHMASNARKFGKSDLPADREGKLISRSARLMKNFKKLEQVYFSARMRAKQFAGDSIGRHSSGSSLGWGSVAGTEGCNVSSVDSLAGTIQQKGGSKNDRLGSFFDSLCKYLHYSKFKVKANLKQGDLLNSSNLVCSLSFDRDKEFFATAGVNKRIKVFECNMILNEDVDIHYPVIELTTRSKLSSICWNSYIKNQIASSDFEGVVRLWDVTRYQALMDFKEHGRRVWSVDFSQSDPTRLASGSDDGTVKLWNINQGGSIGTIRTKANVCCVQFPPDSAHLIAFGSADFKIYCYDLRNLNTPLCILASHSKTVSYVKFLDSATLVSASTDNTLRLWDLATNKARVLSNPVRTFMGHTNVKNFVGLSVADGYIATGSETNEVFAYHKSLPMPMASYKFNSADPVTGHEIEDDGAEFVSCVSWRGQTQTLVAANSAGNIKLLEMV
eukprot:Gb_40887 [translate_table: standard]